MPRRARSTYRRCESGPCSGLQSLASTRDCRRFAPSIILESNLPVSEAGLVASTPRFPTASRMENPQ